MTSSLPIDRHDDRSRFPRRATVTYRPGPFHRDDEVEVLVPTETGDMVSIILEHRRGSLGHRDEYTFHLDGSLVDIAPEALTAAVQMAFLALREARALALVGARALDELAADLEGR